MLNIRISTSPLDPFTEIERYQKSSLVQGAFGACNVFIGSMRDFNEDAEVEEMFLEHYPGMTDRHLQRIADEAVSQWEISDLLLNHRVGKVLPGDPIVVIAVWSAHRAESFAACRFLIEELKSRAPFWKKETSGKGSRWVQQNTPGI